MEHKLPSAPILYDKTKLIIGMSLLTTESIYMKAETIYGLLHDIMRQDIAVADPALILYEQVRYFITIYLMVACNFLPMLANDYPQDNKVNFLKLFKLWNENL